MSGLKKYIYHYWTYLTEKRYFRSTTPKRSKSKDVQCISTVWGVHYSNDDIFWKRPRKQVSDTGVCPGGLYIHRRDQETNVNRISGKVFAKGQYQRRLGTKLRTILHKYINDPNEYRMPL